MLAAGAFAAAVTGCADPAPAPAAVVTPIQVAQPAATATWVGSNICAACHADASGKWRDSHHARALMAATPGTVSGDFDGMWRGGGERRFRAVREGDAFFFEVDEGEAIERLPVRWTIGFTPLQQYLVERSGGRWQAFTWVWDARTVEQGGQRWYFLYDDEPTAIVAANHWDGPRQNANHQCVACHAVGFEKGTLDEGKRLESRLAEAGVGCESCHGPGSAHVEWAAAPAGARGTAPVWSRLDGQPVGALEMSTMAAIAQPAGAGQRARSARVDQVCGNCHSRRTVLPAATGEDLPGLQVARLSDGLYHPDGRMRDEVFNLGSFRQSRMHEAGVACTHCHDPHGGGLRAPGNAVCADCHAPAVFDDVAHMGHVPGTPGGQCVDCHMPTTSFMGIDARHDHAFARPDPEEAARVGSPTPCASCHAGESATWMAEAIRGWQREGAKPARRFADALHAAWQWQPEGAPSVAALAADTRQAAIVRASALDALANVGVPLAPGQLQAAVADPSPDIRSAAARLVLGSPAGSDALLERLLSDPDAGVRFTALHAALDAGRRLDASPVGRRLAQVAGQWRPLLESDADRASACVLLGRLALAEGNLTEARLWFERGRQRDPSDAAAVVALAEFLWQAGDSLGALDALRALVALNGDDARGWHAYGLMQVRAGEGKAALRALARAVALAPEEPRFAYVLAVAEYDLGERVDGTRRMQALASHRPGYRPAVEAARAWAKTP